MISAIVGSRFQFEQSGLIAACTALIRLDDEIAGACNRSFGFFTETYFGHSCQTTSRKLPASSK